jgi:hypothetical protein
MVAVKRFDLDYPHTPEVVALCADMSEALIYEQTLHDAETSRGHIVTWVEEV